MKSLLPCFKNHWTWIATAFVIWVAGILFWLFEGGGDIDLDNIISLVTSSFIMMPQFFLLSVFYKHVEPSIWFNIIFYAFPVLLIAFLHKIKAKYLPWVYMAFLLFCLFTLKGCVYDFPKEL